MRILALVPARGGSRRLPGKNIRLLGGKPLIAWTLDLVREYPGISDVLVSTDDPAIADVASRAGVQVPWLRPSELSTAEASSVDVALHALDRYENDGRVVDGLLLLQPTSPFRECQMIDRALELFRDCAKPIVSVTEALSHPAYCFRLENGRLSPFLPGSSSMVAPVTERAYVVNGSLYLISPKRLREGRSFFSEDMVPLVTTTLESTVDIDTERDWELAEALVPLAASRAQ